MRISQGIDCELCGLLLVLGLAGCSSYTTYATESLPRQEEIKIDGKTDDWLGFLSIIEDGSASVGFRNDGENLYVCLMVEEETLQAQPNPWASDIPWGGHGEKGPKSRLPNRVRLLLAISRQKRCPRWKSSGQKKGSLRKWRSPKSRASRLWLPPLEAFLSMS
jgi:hypothetical protein